MNFFSLHAPEHAPPAPEGPRCPAPDFLPAFPMAERVAPIGGRVRWKEPDGSVLEWDSRGAALEMYSPHGWHLGEFDHVQGGLVRPADPGRRLMS